jgi:hypothetical protein
MNGLRSTSEISEGRIDAFVKVFWLRNLLRHASEGGEQTWGENLEPQDDERAVPGNHDGTDTLAADC